MKIRVLGCGTSSGVPRIGNDWGACDPSDPRNRRLRVSVLVEHENTRILVDTGPDMREQLLAANVGTVDAVIWTHEHADHVFGIDDLRQVFHQLGRPVQGYARPRTKAQLESMFSYVFQGHDGYPPTVTLEELPDELTIGSMTVRVTDQPHGSITSAGLRFDADGKSFGYATDISGMSGGMMNLYRGLDLWIVDALRRRPHPTHPHLDQALTWIDELAPRRAALTHMDQSMDYATLAAELPPGVEPGFDGQEFVL
ncbi:phosphoribosyl 1,2-cyclic phosphate phosphodiesterase [Sphingomonas sp. OV641]|uniref:MBL fold metallo-hydrolase n=1 Tax=Sphingomonas sp. OV641 TaxID=1881068 RepID=UPI0008C464F9|nr:MBL fold metallo-hydrolase [Sphingomonas sp. OV641]SEI99810.1 phosphoribosyl 1,2-cyclic phosphate phosphodiesterase [Sphingomonas sp. OV641]